MCSNGRVCTSSVPAHIMYQQRLQCVRTSVCLCQRGFPFASVAQSHTGRGRGGTTAPGAVEEQSNIHTKTESECHTEKYLCIYNWPIHTPGYILSDISYEKVIKVTQINRAGKHRQQ